MLNPTIKGLAGLLLALLFTPAAGAQTVKKNVIHTWENVGKIVEVTGKTFTIRRNLRLSEATWSLLPGAVSEGRQLQTGSEIHAKGSTLPDGTYDAKRIFLISDSSSRQQASTGGGVVRGSDHGGPETKAPQDLGTTGNVGLEDRGRGVPGRENRLPPTGRPGDSGRGAPGGLQSSRSSSLPRFLPGDVQGVVEQAGPEQLILSQTFYFDKASTVVGTNGDSLKGKDLKPGQRVAVTIKDEVDEKTQSRKATVIRLLP